MKASNVHQIYVGDPVAGLLVIEKLAAWRWLGALFGFDSWIANVDRHCGNLLFSGNNEIWLIDHGQSFTGPAWNAAELQPDGQYRNRLNEWLTPWMSEQRRQEATPPAGAMPEMLAGIDLRDLGRINYVIHILSDGDFIALVGFLKDRVQHVPRLSAKALGLLA